MSQTVSPSTSRCYGLARVSSAWSVSRAGVYRFLSERHRRPPKPPTFSKRSSRAKSVERTLASASDPSIGPVGHGNERSSA